MNLVKEVGMEYAVINADFEEVVMFCFDYPEAEGWVLWFSENYKNNFYIDRA